MTRFIHKYIHQSCSGPAISFYATDPFLLKKIYNENEDLTKSNLTNKAGGILGFKLNTVRILGAHPCH